MQTDMQTERHADREAQRERERDREEEEIKNLSCRANPPPATIIKSKCTNIKIKTKDQMHLQPTVISISFF